MWPTYLLFVVVIVRESLELLNLLIICFLLLFEMTMIFLFPRQLEAMGFDRALVLEVFVACNRNEELAANYLLDHMHEFED